MVAWLEDLAGYKLDEEERRAMLRGGTGALFLQDQGLPTATRAALRQTAGHSDSAELEGFVRGLDPDATTRFDSP